MNAEGEGYARSYSLSTGLFLGVNCSWSNEACESFVLKTVAASVLLHVHVDVFECEGWACTVCDPIFPAVQRIVFGFVIVFPRNGCRGGVEVKSFPRRYTEIAAHPHVDCVHGWPHEDFIIMTDAAKIVTTGQLHHLAHREAVPHAIGHAGFEQIDPMSHRLLRIALPYDVIRYAFFRQQLLSTDAVDRLWLLVALIFTENEWALVHSTHELTHFTGAD